MVYFFWRDDKTTLRIKKVGGYDCLEGTKIPGAMPGEPPYFFPRYRASIEFEFGNPNQEDGHGVADGDYARDFAERVYQCIKEGMPSTEEFVKVAKAAGVYRDA